MADDGPPPPTWDKLTQEQRDTLIAPLRQRWDDAPQERARMLEHAQRWKALSPQQRQDARRGMRRFEDMNPRQRREARVLFEQMRSLPPDQRDRMRTQWKAMTPEQRTRWVDQHDDGHGDERDDDGPPPPPM